MGAGTPVTAADDDADKFRFQLISNKLADGKKPRTFLLCIRCDLIKNVHLQHLSIFHRSYRLQVDVSHII